MKVQRAYQIAATSERDGSHQTFFAAFNSPEDAERAVRELPTLIPNAKIEIQRELSAAENAAQDLKPGAILQWM